MQNEPLRYQLVVNKEKHAEKMTPEDLENCFYKACAEEHKKYVLEWTKPVSQRSVVEAGWKAVLELCEREFKK
jgi:hypothetical protein